MWLLQMEKPGEALRFADVQKIMRFFSLLFLMGFAISKAIAADPAADEATKTSDQNNAGSSGVGEHLAGAHAARERQCKEAPDQDQRYPVGNRHGQKVRRRGERHHRRKKDQSDSVCDHEPFHLTNVAWALRSLQRRQS